jgi:hypothetical protein
MLLASLGDDQECWDLARDTLGRLQARLEQEAEEVAAEASRLRRHGARDELWRVAGSLMQHHLERFEEVLEGLVAPAALSR